MKLAVYAALALLASMVHGQGAYPDDPYAIAPKSYNFSSFSQPEPVADLEEVRAATSEALQAHPEFGTVPYRTQCKDCHEILDKRTLDERFFVKNGTGGQTFYVQKIYGQLHYIDAAGQLLTIDERLSPTAQAGLYTADRQIVPTGFDQQTGLSSIRVGGATLRYNGETRLLLDDGLSLSDYGLLDKSKTQVGEDGVLTTSAWHNVDRVQYFRQGAIKTNFVVQGDLGLPAGTEWVVIEDHFELPSGHSLHRDGSSGSPSLEGYWMGDLVVRNVQGLEIFRFGQPVLTDANPDKYGRVNLLQDPSATVIAYEELVQGKDVRLRIRVAADWLGDPGRTYPITIDPLVSGTATFSAGQMGFRYDAACWNATNFCGYNLNVNVPGQSTLTNAFMNAQYISEVWGCGIFVDCWMSEASFRVVGPCGNSPPSPFYWTCLSPAGDAPGTCSGVNNPAAATVTCVPPQCPNYNLSFQMRNYFCFCSAGGCGTSCQRMPNNSWVMTVEARTIESSSQANSTPIVYNGSCGVPTTVEAIPNFGVPGYSYLWSGGPNPTAQSQAVTHNSNGTYSYTVTVTDACGQTSVSSVDIVIADCPLPVELEYLRGEAEATANVLHWKSASEANLDAYLLERSENNGEFSLVAEIKAANAPHAYTFRDPGPLPAQAVYRLRVRNQEGGELEGDQVEIRREPTDFMQVSYAPEDQRLELKWESERNGSALLELYALDGRQVHAGACTERAGAVNQHAVDVSGLGAGVYIVKFRGRSQRVYLGR